MKRTLRGALRAALAAAFVFAAPAGAQQDFSKAQVKVIDLGSNTFMLEGVGGNITVAAGRDAAIMVDGQFAPMHDKIMAAVTAMTGVPIKYLVNTHFHGDHTGGNAAFNADGVTTVAHENVAKRLAAGSTDGLSGQKTAPAPKEALPKRTYDKQLTLEVQGRTARIGHPLNAHTDGDSYVYFADANVLATGDIISMGNRYPSIDYANGGSIDGIIVALDNYLKLADGKTRVVPGHGPLGDKIMIGSYRVMMITARDRIARYIAEGKSEEEAVADKPFADLDKQMGANEQQSAGFVRAVYRSLKKA